MPGAHAVREIIALAVVRYCVTSVQCPCSLYSLIDRIRTIVYAGIMEICDCMVYLVFILYTFCDVKLLCLDLFIAFERQMG